MKIAEYKQIDTHIVEEEVLIPAVCEQDENGETVIIIPEHTEIVRKEVPVMRIMYRDATPDEIAREQAEQAEMERMEAMREPTFEEQMDARVLYLELMAGLLNEEE